jgi:tetraacyldisaccharide 4'-kinase
MENWLQKQWYSYTAWHVILVPVSWLFLSLVTFRKFLYRLGWFKSFRLPVPVVVVGNINIGGTGKTPLVIWLVEQLQEAGFKPGVISRGYGGDINTPTLVKAHSEPLQVGDEPVLIAKRCRCPVYVNANRVKAAQALLNTYPECNIIISDDGLQHYRLQRDVEIVVIDGEKGLGNGALLPAGPLREPATRLKKVDAVVVNGVLNKLFITGNVPNINMQLVADTFYNLQNPDETANSQTFSKQRVLAIAGIGNPARFFQQLTQMGIQFKSQAFPDHYAFKESDFNQHPADAILMTEKDAVKCQAFAKSSFWVLPVKAMIKNDLMTIILNKLRQE